MGLRLEFLPLSWETLQCQAETLLLRFKAATMGQRASKSNAVGAKAVTTQSAALIQTTCKRGEGEDVGNLTVDAEGLLFR